MLRRQPRASRDEDADPLGLVAQNAGRLLSRACRVDPDGQVVGDELLDVLRKRRGTITVGDRLGVGNHQHQIYSLLLEPDSIEQGSEQMTEVQLTGRAITGQHARAEHLGARIDS